MTTSGRDLISAAALEAFTDGEANCAGVLDRRLTANAHDSRCCARAGLAAALPLLTAGVRAAVAEEIAAAIDANYVGSTPNGAAVIAYHHAAALARQLRVPDCGDQYHGADGGPCAGCGFDAADAVPSGPAQVAAAASEGAGGRSGPETAPQPATGDDRRPGWPLPSPLVAAQPRTGAHSPAASPDQPDAAQTASGPRVPASREVAHAEIADRTHPDVTAHAKYAYDVLCRHRPDTTQED